MSNKHERVPMVYKNIVPHRGDVMVYSHGERYRILEEEDQDFHLFLGAELLDENYKFVKFYYVHMADFYWATYYVLCYHDGGHEK